MIEAYFRPKDLDEAVEILSRKDGKYLPLGGGVTLSRGSDDPISLVDLQSLGLDGISQEGQFLIIGATAKLQDLAEFTTLQPDLKCAILSESNINLRRQATAAGALVTANGRSTFGTVLLALDAVLKWLPGEWEQYLGEYFALRIPPRDARLVTKIQVPLNCEISFEKVARTPEDLPILCIALARWPSGRTRIALGGYGPTPILAFDAPEPGGVEDAVTDALSRAEDAWASAAYRQDVGAKLIRRMMNR
ncbi:MAG: FAD binding domain-containing protein [Bellilinea sp.]